VTGQPGVRRKGKESNFEDDEDNRIFMGGIPFTMTEYEV
jgi:hypothetical protein